MPAPALVALDWGTSSLRAWLLGPGAEVLDGRRSGQGLLSITRRAQGPVADAYESVLSDTCGDWLAGGTPALACGMVGSAHGWVDAGYRDVPTPLSDPEVVTVGHRSGLLHVVSGLRLPSTAGRPGDVMRGEETQVVGVLDVLAAAGDLTVVLPGTHSKWVSVRDGVVETFTTSMTGELYAVLLEHSILATTARDPVRDDEAFKRGLATAQSGRGVQAELFGARAAALAGSLPATSVPDHVSGVLIGDEVAHLLPAYGSSPLVLCGGDELCRRYTTALAAHGVEPRHLAEDVTVRGLWRTAVSAGLVDA